MNSVKWSQVRSLELLEEIIKEILSRLPVKSLCRFRCIAKSWHSLIGTRIFINKHLQNSATNNSHWRVVFGSWSAPLLLQFSLLSYMDEPSVHPSPFDDPMAGVLVGACNGLLCILKNPGRQCFFLWNPATRISFGLPEVDYVTPKYGFGWDGGSDAYKVFAIVFEQEKSIGKIYSTRTKSWKIVDHDHLSLCNGRGKLAYGKIYWLTTSGYRIEWLDLKSEVFGMIDPPCKPEARVRQWLFERRGFLIAICLSKKLKSWVLRKNGVKESWAEEIMITEAGKRFADSFEACFYIESLVSPDPEKN